MHCFAVGSPAIPMANTVTWSRSVVNQAHKGKSLVIEVKNNQPVNYYIQSATLNGKSLPGQWIFHDELVKGGKLKLEMGNTPNKNWGSLK